MPFKKGNKLGKIKKKRPSPIDIIKEKTNNGQDIVDTLVKILNNQKSGKRDKISAAKLLASYLWGAPTQHNDTNLQGNIAFSWKKKTDAEDVESSELEDK